MENPYGTLVIFSSNWRIFHGDVLVYRSVYLFLVWPNPNKTGYKQQLDLGDLDEFGVLSHH